MKPKISLIAAIDEHGALGKGNDLIFKIPEDMKRFREITRGHVVVMGRKTYESIGRLLPDRLNIIVTRDGDSYLKGHPGLVSACLPAGRDLFNRCRNEFGMTTKGVVVNSIEAALKVAKEKETEEIFIIGGGQIFKDTISMADKLYLTIVEGEYEADTYFPEYKEFKKVVFEQECESGGYRYKFLDLER